MNHNFRQEYLCEFVEPTREDRRALELWCLYHVQTEEYDRAVCQFDVHGIAIPITSAERNACTQNAFRAMRDIFSRAVREGIPWTTMEKAQREVSRLRWAEILELAGASAAPT